ncbi:hypothetical protein Tco_1567291, partial [Tanacetum coccineum]
RNGKGDLEWFGFVASLGGKSCWKASVQDDPGNSSSVVVSKDKKKRVNDKVLDVVAKDKPKGSASFVVVSKDKRKESSEKENLMRFTTESHEIHIRIS